MLTRIHVRRDLIAADRRDGTISRVFGVETSGKKKRYGRGVIVFGPSKFVYRPDKPLGCGARAWIETKSAVAVKR
jgi:hypothetical protein